MSGHDLYLVLRERVETVAEGFTIGKDVLDAAQQARGFSHERMGRELEISEKTWRRWKAAGVVPYEKLDDVAKVLRLELERPQPQRIVVQEVSGDELALLRGEIQELRAAIDRVEMLVRDAFPGAPASASSR
jgi:hypothetical protein